MPPSAQVERVEQPGHAANNEDDGGADAAGPLPDEHALVTRADQRRTEVSGAVVLDLLRRALIHQAERTTNLTRDVAPADAAKRHSRALARGKVAPSALAGHRVLDAGRGCSYALREWPSTGSTRQ